MQQVCAGCNGAVVGRWCRSNGRLYHPACFRCDKCHRPLDKLGVYVPDGTNKYCKTCHNSIKSPSPSKPCYSRSRAMSEYQHKPQRYKQCKNSFTRPRKSSTPTAFSNNSIKTANYAFIRNNHYNPQFMSQSARVLNNYSNKSSIISNNGFKSMQNLNQTTLRWYIDAKLLNHHKHDNIGAQLTSNVYKSMWTIILRPNGKSNQFQTAGKCIICLKLCSLPYNISSLSVKWTVFVRELNRTTTWTNSFNYNQRIWECDIMTFSEFKKLESMSIEINIEIMNQTKQRSNSCAVYAKYAVDVVDELVTLGIGTREECIKASAQVVNHKDINAVQAQVQEIQYKAKYGKHTTLGFTNKAHSRSRAASSTHRQQYKYQRQKAHRSTMNFQSSQIFEEKPLMNELSKLSMIVNQRLHYMENRNVNVNKSIDASNVANLLRDAQTKALVKQKQMLHQIGHLNTMCKFLNDIILIENLFDREYTFQQRRYQKSARSRYALNIQIYENKPKPIGDASISSFVGLMFTAQTDLNQFKRWLQWIEHQCKQNNVNIRSSSGAAMKNMDRSFYKSFYVYSNNGHQQMTDVLRCSLVFNSFDDLYRCFAVIEESSKAYGGILRCKDRFNTDKVPFGYRDLLINIRCPKSMIICEIQLHHISFYNHKKISHHMYETARLFEVDGNNLAYEYADQYIRPVIGNAIYTHCVSH